MKKEEFRSFFLPEFLSFYLSYHAPYRQMCIYITSSFGSQAIALEWMTSLASRASSLKITCQRFLSLHNSMTSSWLPQYHFLKIAMYYLWIYELNLLILFLWIFMNKNSNWKLSNSQLPELLGLIINSLLKRVTFFVFFM